MSRWLAVVLGFCVVSSDSWGQTKNPAWQKVTADAGGKPRDSQGELVYKDHLWIFGGWFQSFEAPPRDVWRSADGKSWQLVEAKAPWIHSDLPMTVTFQDKMWIMGGWFNGRLKGHSASNTVWSSTDGKNWEQVAKAAAWSPRIASGLVSFKNRMWLLGGTENYYFGDDKSLKNDVWSSADGKEWKLETANAGWSPRAYHAAVVHDGKIWVFGGGNYVPKYQAHHDVWASSDGVHWENVTPAAPWSPRIWFSAEVYRGHLWVLGGWSNNPSKNWGDVWYSRDGKTWKQYQSGPAWKERHEHSAFVFQDKLWIAGGHATPLSSEVWSLELPKDWKGD